MDCWSEKPYVKNGPSLYGHGAVAANAALTSSITKVRERPRKTLTWDGGKEPSGHAFAFATGTKVYFAGPHLPGSGRPARTPTVY